MKFVCLVHGYPPFQNAGAEWMLHEINKYLVKSGHSVEVLVPVNKIEPYDIEGIKVNIDNWKSTTEKIKNCDAVISHLDRAGKALNICEYYHKPFIEIIHNTNFHDILNAKHKEKGQGRFVYLVYNSFFTQREMSYSPPSVVVHPPVDPKRYKVKRGKKITLINLFERKGGHFFQDIARLMPEYEFLGVKGGYGQQIVNDNMPNIEYMENTPDAKKIYSKTRILLMPSLYESYGRTAIEAMCSGIPVIANPTDGLKESCGNAGIFCNIESPLSWVEAIKKLDDIKEYKMASDIALKRVDEIQSEQISELDKMEKFFMDIIFKRI
jgi:glycosyltransferase involved in cell wall biosynthesis